MIQHTKMMSLLLHNLVGIYTIIEPRREKNLPSIFLTMYGSNQPAQLHRLANVMKNCLYQICVNLLFRKRITMALISAFVVRNKVRIPFDESQLCHNIRY